MTTATGHRSGRFHKAVSNGRFYAALIATVMIVSTVCNTIVEVYAR